MPHILIVEDETIIRSALRRLLERNQYQVSEAGSVQEAQERFSIPTFDLIVSDLRLPGAPGTELIKLGQGTPVLIMTSYASLRSAVDSMNIIPISAAGIEPVTTSLAFAELVAHILPNSEICRCVSVPPRNDVLTRTHEPLCENSSLSARSRSRGIASRRLAGSWS